ncbi:hypothetical protein [Ignavibacterium sp.]|uniref:hypothetical protein n=1 Tax=Ignavibacterium sp. TaxID=2651167 RepID=UPI00307DE35B
MSTENTMQLVKELDKINNTISINSYRSSWISFIVSLAYLVFIFIWSANQQNNFGVNWVMAMLYVFSFILLFVSFYQIIRYIFNKKLSLIIQSILDLEKK